METKGKPWVRAEHLWLQRLSLGTTALKALVFHPNVTSCLHAVFGGA